VNNNYLDLGMNKCGFVHTLPVAGLTSPHFHGPPIVSIRRHETRQRRIEFYRKALLFLCYFLHPVRSLRYSNCFRFSLAKPPHSKIFHYQEDKIPISWRFCI
jgi:hypothetical protein